MKVNILLSLFLITLFISCNNDNAGPVNPVTLNFNQEATQDQMGDFADNTITIFNSKIWSVAGINTSSSPNFHHDVWYSDNGVAWASVADNFLEGRRGTTLTHFNGKLWVVGGENNAGNALHDIWSSTDGEHWTLEVASTPFGAIKFHSTVVFNNKLFVIAGNLVTEKTEVWSSANGIDWSQNTANANDAFFGRGGHKALVFNNAIYVIGGEATTRLNDVWKSTNGTNWTQVVIQADVLPRITGHTATVYNSKVWVIGGRAGTADFSNDIYYTSDMITWTKYKESIPFEAIAFHNVVNYNNALWLFGGYKTGGLSGAIWKITEE